MATEQILQNNAKATQLAYSDGALPPGYTRQGNPLVDPSTGAYAIIGQNAAGHVIVRFAARTTCAMPTPMRNWEHHNIIS